MSGIERRLRSAVVRADLARSTGLRHVWRRWQHDAVFAVQAAPRRQRVSSTMWREAAEAIGATIADLSPPFAELRRGQASTRVMGETTVLNDFVAVCLADDKPLVHALLAEAGLPTPVHAVVGKWSAGEAFLSRISESCIVKPARGSGGEGITGAVRRPTQLRRAVREAGLHDEQVLIERQLVGDVYRALVLDGQILDVIRRRPPRVLGDGRSTIEELIFAEYDERLTTAHDIPVKRFVVDLDCIFTLEEAGLRLDHVLPVERSAVVKTVSNFNRPDDNETLPESVHRSFESEVAAAASVLGLRLAGVDIVTQNPDTSISSGGGVILEVNGRPALHHHQHVADRSNAIPVAAKILDVLL
jgi:D-alanine-D-alanine ligase-like ATP-grasp enzyme